MIYLFSLKIRRLKNKKVDFFEVDFEKTQSTPNTIFKIINIKNPCDIHNIQNKRSSISQEKLRLIIGFNILSYFKIK